MEKKSQITIQSLERGLHILEHLSNSIEPLSVAELCALTGIQRTTLYGLINTLISEGYITKEERSGRYSVTSKMFMLSRNYTQKDPISVNSEKSVVELAAKYPNILVRAVRFQDLQVVELLYSSGSTTLVGPNAVNLSDLKALPATSSGKMVCSSLTDNEIFELFRNHEFARFTNNTITNTKDLIEEIRKIRAQGYATDNGELMENTYCMSFPIRDSSNAVIGAIGFSGEQADMLAVRDAVIADGLQHSKLISIRLGWKMG